MSLSPFMYNFHCLSHIFFLLLSHSFFFFLELWFILITLFSNLISVFFSFTKWWPVLEALIYISNLSPLIVGSVTIWCPCYYAFQFLSFIKVFIVNFFHYLFGSLLIFLLLLMIHFFGLIFFIIIIVIILILILVLF